VLNQNAIPYSGGVFGANSSAAPPPPAQAMYGGAPQAAGLFGSRSLMARKSAPGGPVIESEEYMREEADESDDDMGFGLFDDDAPAGAPKPLVFEEGAWEESGMTTVSERVLTYFPSCS